MRQGGLIPGVAFATGFMKASPAGAGQNLQALLLDFEKVDIFGVSLSLFGTANLDSLSSDQHKLLRSALEEFYEELGLEGGELDASMYVEPTEDHERDNPQANKLSMAHLSKEIW